jgi:predicted SAM-dependent methyltransferase
MAKKKLLKLNLGCGTDYRSGWVNIDAVAEVKPDLVHDLHKPLPFPDSSVDQILAQDILEHFTKEDVQKLIAEISRVLDVHGKLEVRVPNIDDIITRFADFPETRNEFLYGTTEFTGIFGAHKVGYTPEMMTRFMMEHGLQLIRLELENTNYHFVFQKANKHLEATQIVSWIEQDDFLQSIFKKMEQRKVLSVNSGWSLTQALQKNKIDVVVLSGFYPQVIGTLLTKLFGVAVVWAGNHSERSQLTKFFKVPLFFYYAVKKLPQTVIMSTVEMKNNLTRLHVALEKLVVIPAEKKKPEALYLLELDRALRKQVAENVVKKFV